MAKGSKMENTKLLPTFLACSLYLCTALLSWPAVGAAKADTDAVADLAADTATDTVAGMDDDSEPVPVSSTRLTKSVVKIFTTAETYNTYSPWNSDTESRIGTGFVIEGNRVLTNAHVVADHTFIELQRDGKPDRYEAEVIAVSHEADLALLSVKDRDFFSSGNFMPIGELPIVHEEISVYGFPTGGDTLSVTKGIVSRIEYIEYAHSSLPFQAIQIDAAINPGNSGGPALANGKVVGVAMQVAGNGEENIGYMIPTPIIHHFLKDVEDGRYDGFPEFSVITEELINPAMRKKYSLDKDTTGVLVTKVCANTPAEPVLRLGDIITHVDGKKIENNGTVLFQPGKYINFEHLVDLHQLNERLQLSVLRDDKPLALELPLDRAAQTYYTYDQKPRYFVYGGFVFTPSKVTDYCLSRAEYDRQENRDRQESVLITKVLASSSNVGYHDVVMRVDTIDGETFKNFNDFYHLIRKAKGAFVILADQAGFQVVIEREVAQAEHEDLLKRYHMEAGQSDDLKGFDEHFARADSKTLER